MALDAGFFAVTYVEVVQPSAPQAAASLRTYRRASDEAGGFLHFEVMQRLERSNQFVILAAWQSQAAFEAHVATPQSTELNRELAGMLAAPNDTRQHHPLAVGNGVEGSGDSITAVTHVDVIPQFKDDGVIALTELAEASRKHGGNLRFDVWQQTNRLNHCTVVETWSDRAAFDAHAMAAETRDFRARLAPMTGALYDERLYGALS